MAHVRKGLLTKPPQWWKHLRSWKKVFWGRERKNAKRDTEHRKTDARDGGER